MNLIKQEVATLANEMRDTLTRSDPHVLPSTPPCTEQVPVADPGRPRAHQDLVSVACWNCCGLGLAVQAVADKRLTDDLELSRGCGGVAILWRKSLNVTVLNIASDRICAIQLRSEDCVVSVIEVYLPSSNLPVEEYQECVHLLEEVVTDCQRSGEVVVLGDFNAHLKYMEHTGEIEGINPPGLCLAKFIDNSDLYPVSLTSLCTGPAYTYHSGDHFTTIDYVLAGLTFAPYIS